MTDQLRQPGDLLETRGFASPPREEFAFFGLLGSLVNDLQVDYAIERGPLDEWPWEQQDKSRLE